MKRLVQGWQWIRQRVSLVGFVLIFAVVGTILLIGSRAAGPSVTIESEQGSLSGNATVGSDSNASGGQFIQFGAAPEIKFPDDANFTNVKSAPYNAKGDGVNDDSDELLAAFLANDWFDDATNNPHVARGAPRTVYLPAGTYLVSKSLAIEGSSVRIVGAGKGRTIIKLKDNTFTNANSPQYVLMTGSARFFDSNLANTGFANYIQNLTIDVGSNNPGAGGIRYYVANHGAMEHVEIKSSDTDREGKYGIGFITSAGPALMKDVTITGFDYGVYLDNYANNVLTFQDLRLDSQRQAGIYNEGKNIVLENLVSVNNPVTIQTESNSAAVMMINSTLDGTGSGPAINLPVKGFLYLRDITTTDYGNIVKVGSTNSFNGKTSLKEWSTENYRVGNTAKTWTEDNAYVGLHLPVKKAPEFYTNDFSKWVSVTSKGATAATSSTDSANNNDDAPAVQAAIDSGAEIVYFPYGYYTLRSQVHVRANVKKIDFMHSSITSVSGANFVIDGVNSGTVILEGADMNSSTQQNGSSTVVVRNMRGGDVNTGANATGDVFVENAGAHAKFTITKPIGLWARSIDRTQAEWTNTGATMWILSSNIESDMTHNNITNGGKIEFIGGTNDNLGQVHTEVEGPVYSSTNSYMSIFMPGSYRDNGGELARWDYFVHDDPSSGATTDLKYDDQVFLINNGTNAKFVLPMYVTPGYTYP